MCEPNRPEFGVKVIQVIHDSYPLSIIGKINLLVVYILYTINFLKHAKIALKRGIVYKSDPEFRQPSYRVIHEGQ